MSRLAQFVRRTPGPRWLIALYLSLRWRCRVSPGARVDYPLMLTIGRGARIGRATIIASGRGIAFGESVELSDGSVLNAQGGRIVVGDRSAIGPFVVIYGEGTVSLGTDVSVAAHSTIVAAEHVFERRGVPIRRQGSIGIGIRIEKDVWVASNCVVLDDVTIHEGSVVAAGAVVTKSVDPYMVMAGVPAKPLRRRDRT